MFRSLFNGSLCQILLILPFLISLDSIAHPKKPPPPPPMEEPDYDGMNAQFDAASKEYGNAIGTNGQSAFAPSASTSADKDLAYKAALAAWELDSASNDMEHDALHKLEEGEEKLRRSSSEDEREEALDLLSDAYVEIKQAEAYRKAAEENQAQREKLVAGGKNVLVDAADVLREDTHIAEANDKLNSILEAAGVNSEEFKQNAQSKMVPTVASAEEAKAEEPKTSIPGKITQVEDTPKKGGDGNAPGTPKLPVPGAQGSESSFASLATDAPSGSDSGVTLVTGSKKKEASSEHSGKMHTLEGEVSPVSQRALAAVGIQPLRGGMRTIFDIATRSYRKFGAYRFRDEL